MKLPRVDNEFELLQALAAARAKAKIDGVWFDFTHPGLPANGWLATNLWDVFEELADFNFVPWEAGRKVEEGPVELGASWKRERLQPGDEVFIRAVERFRRGQGELADPHDNQELWAFLAIRRLDGAEEPLSQPVMFVPPDAFEAFSHHESFGRDEDYAAYLWDHAVTFEKIGTRTARLADEIKFGPAYEWIRLAQDMHTQAADMLANGGTWKADARYLAEVSAAAGYALARAEAEGRLVPTAKKGLKAIGDRAKAAEAARKANTKADTASLIAAAKAMCAADPQLSLNACAQALAGSFDREPRNIARSIKHLFEQRNLPNGRREYRPKRGGHTPD